MASANNKILSIAGLILFIIAGSVLLVACGAEATPTTLPQTLPTTGTGGTGAITATATISLATVFPTAETTMTGETPTVVGMMTGTETPAAMTTVTGTMMPGETPSAMSTTTTTTGGITFTVPMSITINAVNGSGENGSAKLIDMGNGKLEVALSLTATPNSTPQPASINNGTCAGMTSGTNPTPNPSATPSMPLNDVINGQSSTVITATMGQLTQAQYSINVSQSASAMSTYVSCGDIAVAGMISGTVTPGTGTVMPETPGASTSISSTSTMAP